MSMTARDRVLARERARGRANAEMLRKTASTMTGTEVIANEYRIPAFVPGHDYSQWPRGGPVADDGQVWQLIQPYDGAAHPGRPGDLRALWSLCHTKDPAQARPWVEPLGTSGMYMRDECYRDVAGHVWRARGDNLVHTAEALPDQWEEVPL